MKTVLVCGLALALCGCASSRPVWVKAGVGTGEFETDRLACEYEAEKSLAAMPGGFGLSGAIASGVDSAVRKIELMTLCLRTKGWNQQAAS